MRVGSLQAVLSLSLIASVMSFAAEPPALELKSLKLGATTTTEQVEAAFSGVKCGEGRGGMQVCNGGSTVANVNVRANIVIDQSGELVRLHFILSASDYPLMKQALSEKLGPGTVTKAVAQNRFGARFPSETVTWKRSKGYEAYLAMNTSEIDKASLNFSTPNDPIRKSVEEKYRKGGKGDI